MKDDICRSKVELRLKQKSLCKAVEVEMVGASALMEAESLLDGKSLDYVLGYLDGFAHCLKLAESLDVISIEDDQGNL